MERSNYIAAIKAKKEIITITPTNSINTFKVIDKDNLIITRSFIREKISGIQLEEELTYDVHVKVPPTELYLGD